MRNIPQRCQCGECYGFGSHICFLVFQPCAEAEETFLRDHLGNPPGSIPRSRDSIMDLLSKVNKPDAEDPSGRTPLAYAASQGQEEVV